MRDLGESRGESRRAGNKRDDEDERDEIGEYTLTAERARRQRGDECQVTCGGGRDPFFVGACYPYTFTHPVGRMCVCTSGYGSFSVSLVC